ncbi:hypothetical protein BpHYR1_010516 [Brachionus plicatilis]|uniref:Uncharacterized protein n=1 Tax=Brachionus plicatilis TaxID=10195 RepID=A0A3M7TBH4_BRAPC|nr:hypothetical protein BpHYR1_010516 [Brachionus plicatilis]
MPDIVPGVRILKRLWPDKNSYISFLLCNKLIVFTSNTVFEMCRYINGWLIAEFISQEYRVVDFKIISF